MTLSGTSQRGLKPALESAERLRLERSVFSHHLIFFQVLDRQPFVMDGETVTPTGPRVPPPAWEAGWKDTVAVGPFEIVRVIARFEGFVGNYAYHCHILEHEDHEMMRQFVVVPPPKILAFDYGLAGASVTFKPSPNRLHSVDWSETLESGSWHPLTSGLGGLDPITVPYPMAANRDRRFYRVRIERSTAVPLSHHGHE